MGGQLQSDKGGQYALNLHPQFSAEFIIDESLKYRDFRMEYNDSDTCTVAVNAILKANVN